ncbi:MAG: hypothetical protein U9Q66_00445 [Patescibacteria group bacterium]|nr:hypothetical protein [Patescibacteria group bacterium]
MEIEKLKDEKMLAITKKKLNRYDYAILKDGISIGTASNQMEYWEALPLDCNMKKFKTLKECVEYISTK